MNDIFVLFEPGQFRARMPLCHVDLVSVGDGILEGGNGGGHLVAVG